MNKTKTPNTNIATHHSLSRFGIMGFTLYNFYVIYAALMPMTNWIIPNFNIVEHLLFDWVNKVYTFDMVQNVLLYLPFGFLFGLASFGKNRHNLTLLLLISLYCLMISSCLELLQAYNPKRASSLVDVIFNVIGGFLGTVIVLISKNYWFEFFKYLRKEIFKEISFLTLISYTGIIAWASYHLYYFLPSLSPEIIQQGIEPLKNELPWLKNNDFTHLHLKEIYWHGALGIGLIILAYGCLNRFQTTILTLFVSSVLFFKILIMGRAPTIEEFIGSLAGVWIMGSIMLLLRKTIL